MKAMEMGVGRPHTRYSLAATVEIRGASLAGTVLAQLGNISLSGCYLYTPQTLAEHTRVRILVHTGQLKADLWGVVRRRDQDGLGVQFTNGSTVEDWKTLEAIIEQLEGLRTKTQSASAY